VPPSVRDALKPKPIEPLEYFKVPGPERGVRIRVRETQ
jgi:hypothetical protein